MSVKVTVAPVMAAPCGSFTVPFTRVTLAWAKALEAMRPQSATASANVFHEKDVKLANAFLSIPNLLLLVRFWDRKLNAYKFLYVLDFLNQHFCNTYADYREV
jgi:hypothetical protein